MPLTIVDAPDGEVAIPPSCEAVVSWNTLADQVTLALRVRLTDGALSGWLPYVRMMHRGASSLDGRDAIATITTDIVRTTTPIAAVEVDSNVTLATIAISTPPETAANVPVARASNQPFELDVVPRSQYLRAHPDERGWCAPTALAMLLEYWMINVEIDEIALAINDARYGGTGNWTFAAAYAGRHGLFGAAAHLRGIADAAALLAAGVPLAASIAWHEDGLPGAPLRSSKGHLVVLRGFSDRRIVVNDPAHPDLVVSYDITAFERCWLGHGGIAYLVAPPERRNEIAGIVNA